MTVEVQTATRGLLQQGTPPRSEQSESQGRQGQAKAREGSFLGLCHRGQPRGPKFWGPLWCTGQQARQGSPAVLARWGPRFTVSLDQLVASFGNKGRTGLSS